MVSTRVKRSSAQARQTVESWPPENNTSAVSVVIGLTRTTQRKVGHEQPHHGLVPSLLAGPLGKKVTEFAARSMQASWSSIPLRRAGEGIVDNAAIALGERLDLGH